jgi:minor fimbrial subunit
MSRIRNVMMKQLAARAVASALLGWSASVGSVAAQESVITVTATVVADACSVATGSETQTVTLDDMSSQELNAAGITGGKKSFSLSLSCPAGTSAVTYTFGGTVDSVDTDSFKSTGTAQNVAVRLFRDDGSTLIEPNGNYRRTLTGAGESVTDSFKVAMYSTGQATSGTVASALNITMQYE